MAVADTGLSPVNRTKRPAPPQPPASIAESVRRAKRHSVAVRTLKFVLPAVAGIIALGFFGYSYLLTPAQISVDLSGTGFSGGKLIMANPKLGGFTRDNRPYSMTAARAIQDMHNTSVIELEKIDAKLPVSDKNWAKVEADEGVYDKDHNTLTIKSNMVVTTTDGMVARLKSAFVEMGKGDMSSSEPVDITLQNAHVAADSLSVQEHGKVLVFDRRVRVVMQPAKHRTAQAADGESDVSK